MWLPPFFRQKIRGRTIRQIVRPRFVAVLSRFELSKIISA
jgi:hypothetical protein